MKRTKKTHAYTLVEIMIAVAIVAILGSVFFTAVQSGALGDRVERAAQRLYSDILYMRMSAVRTNTAHRLNFVSTTEYRIEIYVGGTAPNDWQPVGESRQFPRDTYLTMSSYENAGANLRALPKGLFQFDNSMVADPYVTIEGLNTTKSRIFRVSAGGAIAMENQ